MEPRHINPKLFATQTVKHSEFFPFCSTNAKQIVKTVHGQYGVLGKIHGDWVELLYQNGTHVWPLAQVLFEIKLGPQRVLDEELVNVSAHQLDNENPLFIHFFFNVCRLRLRRF
jgi:hypothetical protein